MFTPSERETFAVHGLIKRSNFLPLEKLANARNVIWQQLAQAGIWCKDGWGRVNDVNAFGIAEL